MKPKTFYNLLAEQNLPLSDQQKEQFERYFELLVEWNEKINLTAITDKEEVYLILIHSISASTSYNSWLKNWI